MVVAMRLLRFLLATLAWACLGSAASLEDLFNLKNGATPTAGVCSADQLNSLRQYLQDVQELTKTVMDAMANWQNDPVMRKHLGTFFGARFSMAQFGQGGPAPVEWDGSRARVNTVFSE